MNISRITQDYIREHPSVADCLDRELINYSALAREICTQKNLDSFEAVLIACRRYRRKNSPKRSHEKRIASLLKNAKVRLKNKIIVAIVEKGEILEKALSFQQFVRKNRGDFHLIEGEEVFVIVTNVEYIPKLKNTFGSKIKRITRDLVEISMIFDEKLETTSGVVAYVYRLFAQHNINIREELSCWTDVMILIDEKDAAKAMDLLSSL